MFCFGTLYLIDDLGRVYNEVVSLTDKTISLRWTTSICRCCIRLTMQCIADQRIITTPGMDFTMYIYEECDVMLRYVGILHVRA